MLNELKGQLVRVCGGAAIKVLKKAGYKLHLTFQTILIKRYLENPEMRFVQIGSNDGMMADPLNYYIQRWRMSGICIEPQKEVFKRLQETYRNRPDLQLLNVAIGHQKGKATMYKVTKNAGVDEKWASGLSSFKRDVVASHEGGIADLQNKIETEEVDTIPLSDVLNASSGTIDLLQIDTEGFDYEIIKMINFKICKPVIIHYEHKHIKDEQKIECINLLASNGYNVLVEDEDTTAVLKGVL